MDEYFKKFWGTGAAGVPVPTWSATAWSTFNSFAGVATLGLISTQVSEEFHHPLLVPAFGAMAVLLFSAIAAPASQPYNTIVGNSLGGLIGVLVVQVMTALGHETMFWLSGALSVSLTIVVQELTNSQHPPGGATALIFAIIMPMHKQKFYYILTPALLGALIMVTMATLLNNLAPAKQYPQFWSPVKSTSASDNDPGLLQTEQSESQTESEPGLLRIYLNKLSGANKEAGPRPVLVETFFSFLGSFVGMSVLGLLHAYFFLPDLHMPVLVAAFGAMSVLIFSLSKAPLSQPINALMGNTLGGLVGVLVVEVMSALNMQKQLWLTGALSVSLTIAVQERLNCVHPPGGATALLYALTPPLQKMHFLFIFAPSFIGTLVLVVMGVVMNNLSPKRSYPQRWLFDDSAAYKEVPAQQMVEISNKKVTAP